MTSFSKIIVLFFVGLSLAGIAWFIAVGARNKHALPLLGEDGHHAGNFNFFNQAGKMITQENVKDKVTVVEYFFTTCPGICKIMNKNLGFIHQQFRDENDFMILSHTVDPQRDSVPVLAKYAKQINATGQGWEFLTGDKTALYDAAKKDYLLAVQNNPGTSIEDEFIHTEYVALLDRQRRIRGFYDATDSLKMIQMVKDIKVLLEK